MEGVSIKALLMSSTLLVPLGITAAWAQENSALARITQEESAKPTLQEASEPKSLLTAFNRRRSSESKEFVVGADGVLSTEENGQKEASTNNHIGNLNKAYTTTGSLSDVTSLGMPDRDNNSRIGNITADQKEATVPECGPSPLSPEEIKSLVEQAAHRHQVDALFATAIAWAESKFDRSRNSEKGARGPMQLMPATAERFSVRDVCDPESNIEGGVKYLRVLLDEFQNPLLVAAAYNAGEGRIYEYGGVPPFKETVGYVAKVVNYQLGVPMPASKKKPVSGSKNTAPVEADANESGVIQVKKTGTFVGGVMHF